MRSMPILFSGAVLACLIMGCASLKSQNTNLPEPRPLVPALDSDNDRDPITNGNTDTTEEKQKNPSEELTLLKALSLVLKQNPTLKTYSWELRARDAEQLQASYLPNPELELETEGIGGSNDYSGFNSSETTIQLSQLVELGGKRALRSSLAGLEYGLAGWDYEKMRLNILTEATKSFTSTLALEKKVDLYEELVRLSNNIFEAVSERVEAGKVSPLEKTKARVILSTSRIRYQEAKRSLIAARTHLASFWGSTHAEFKTLAGDLEQHDDLPSELELKKFLSQNPDYARWMTEIEHAKQTISLEKANRLPDLSLKGGYRRYNETNDRAFTLGVAVPLKLFNRNKGNIRAASQRLLKAEEQQRASIIDVNTRFSETYQLLISARESVEALKVEVLPAAQLAFEASNEGYREGKFGYLDMLDAQRTLFSVKLDYIDALLFDQHYTADIERLIGTNLGTIKTRVNMQSKGANQ